MIAFFDTSALVKLFADEVHSASARRWFTTSTVVMVSQITWAECCAALALKRRTGQLAPDDISTVLTQLKREWPSYQKLAIDSSLVYAAGTLALQHDLRANDSVQLATALRAARSVGSALRLCCFDKALTIAAKQHGLIALEPDSV